MQLWQKNDLEEIMTHYIKYNFGTQSEEIFSTSR